MYAIIEKNRKSAFSTDWQRFMSVFSRIADLGCYS